MGFADDNRSFVKRGTGEWEDVSNKGYVSVEALIDGDNMPQTDLRLDAAKGMASGMGTIVNTLSVTNKGQSTPANFDLTFTAEGYNVVKNVSVAIAPGTQETFDVVIKNVPERVGFEYPLSVAITRIVSGKDAVPSDNTCTVDVMVKRNVVVEEFTGTGCGWCPRGLIGMEKLRNTFGDRFIGIAMHQYNSTDPMYLTNYKNLGLNAAPSCLINRSINTDPYYGTGNDIRDDFKAEMEKGAMASVQVTGKYDDAKKCVNATATVTAMDNLSDLKLAFVLIADSLTGTSNSWKQQNYYTQYSSSSLPEDLSIFGSGGEYGQSSFIWVFNDVAIGTYYEGGQYEMDLGNLDKWQSVKVDYTLEMPTKVALLNTIDYNDVAVIAMLLDENGRVINANKYYMDGRMDNDQQDVTMYGSAEDLKTGDESEFSLYMKNDFEMNGFQFDLILPEGLMLQKDENDEYKYFLSDRFAYPENIQVVITNQPDNTYRVMCFSFTNEIFPSGYGKLISLSLCADKNIASGVYKCTILNATCSLVDGQSIPIESNSFLLNVIGFSLGDVNHDESVNVADVMMTVNHIMGENNPLFYEDWADINQDDHIDVGDVMSIVNIILNSVSNMPSIDNVNLSNMRLTTLGNTTELHMDEMTEYTAFQMEVQIPESVNILDVDLGENSSSHQVVMNAIGDGRFKVVVYSLNGYTFSDSADGTLLRFITDGHVEHRIHVENIQFTTPSYETVRFFDIMETSEIQETFSENNNSEYYNLQGIPVKAPSHGVYIKNGKKMVRK